MRVNVVLNRSSGSLIGGDVFGVAATVVDGLAAAGHRASLRIADGADVSDAIEAATRDCDVVVIGGGDGSVRTAAEVVMRAGLVLGVLPLGTMNRLARELEVPFAIDAAAVALANGCVREIDVGLVNDRIFLCNSLIGLPRQFAERRQALRGAALAGRLSGYAGVIRDMLRARHRMSVDVDHRSAMHKFRTLSIAVTPNRLAPAPGVALRRLALDRGEIALYASHHLTGWGLGLSIVKAMAGLWTQDRQLIELVGHSVTINRRGRRVKVSNDGELETLDLPLRYEVRPRALRVLCPGRTVPQARQPAASEATDVGSDNRYRGQA